MIKNKPVFVFILLIIASEFPAIIGFVLTNNAEVYNGVVFNPMDGYTYLSKMEIGNSGDWLFRLPFTAEAGEGKLLYPFYIGAGHLLRVTGIPLPVGFNILRLISYGLLVFILIHLAGHLFSGKGKSSGLYLFLLAAGGGMGWILIPFGKYGADFWVSEAYPFLAGLANPHFPLALASMVLSLLTVDHLKPGVRFAGMGLIAVILSVLSPFGFVLMAAILSLGWIWEKKDGLSTSLNPVLIFVAAGLPYSIYQYWAVGSTPQMAAWTVQNQTPSPAIWDVILSFSPWIFLVVAGWRFLYNRRDIPVIRRLILWLILGLVFTILPYNLQRRFMIGLSIPISSLGILVLPEVAEKIKISGEKLLAICTALVIPSTILLITMVSFAIGTSSPLYFSSFDELSAIKWLSQQGEVRALVLASDQSGLIIPASSRLRVIYGHPFESVDAVNQKQGVIDFFTGNQNRFEEMKYLDESKAEWIFFGPREKSLGTPIILENNSPTKQFGSVELYNTAEIIN